MSAVRLVGIPLGSYSEGYTNSVIDMASLPQGINYRYDKHHLVPFGEFIPPLFKWFVRLMNIPLGDFNRGALLQASVPVAGARVSPSICFEDLFSDELAVRFLSEADSPTLFANFSNLAWFGDSSAMYQHLHISRMRSLEFQRPFLRVSNTGLTSVIDHQGRIIAALDPLARGVLHATVQGREGLTPFARWSARWGQWPLWILGISLLLAAYLLPARKPANMAGAPQP
jgi:apolipoprotein N-acyltransferase